MGQSGLPTNCSSLKPLGKHRNFVQNQSRLVFGVSNLRDRRVNRRDVSFRQYRFQWRCCPAAQGWFFMMFPWDCGEIATWESLEISFLDVQYRSDVAECAHSYDIFCMICTMYVIYSTIYQSIWCLNMFEYVWIMSWSVGRHSFSLEVRQRWGGDLAAMWPLLSRSWPNACR